MEFLLPLHSKPLIPSIYSEIIYIRIRNFFRRYLLVYFSSSLSSSFFLSFLFLAVLSLGFVESLLHFAMQACFQYKLMYSVYKVSPSTNIFSFISSISCLSRRKRILRESFSIFFHRWYIFYTYLIIIRNNMRF